MLGYYLQLAAQSFRRRAVLTVLMVVSVGLGIGATMTTIAVFKLLVRDPVPERTAQLFTPSIDPRGYTPDTVGQPRPSQLTLRDAQALMSGHAAHRQAEMTGGRVVISTPDDVLRPVSGDARYTTHDFFSMFAAPFSSGAAWTDEEDARAARVVVISDELSNRAFGGTSAVGKTIIIAGESFRVVGVLSPWQVFPHFYDLSSGVYSAREMVFLPFETARALKLRFQGNAECWGSGEDAMNQKDWLAVLWSGTADCAWIQYWVQLRGQTERDAFLGFVRSYASDQVRAGRFARHDEIRVYGLLDWLDYQKILPPIVRLQVAIALSFLLVCLVNAMILMLTKFLANGQSVGVRRALGATKRNIFAQYLVESACVGGVGGILGALIAVAGTGLVRMQPIEYAARVHVDTYLLLAAIVGSVLATTMAGLLPAWLVCRVQPSRALKSS